jgi:serine/threonine protein kinase
VLLCRNTKLNRDVAIKVLTNLSERAKRQFASEATNLASLHNHPNIVQIHSAFERMLPGHAEPFKFIQMEYVRDGNLKQRLDQHKFTHAECMQCFLQLISTVKYLHGQRMLHCDIKPENVLLGKDHKDGSVLYKLADFGLSKDESMSATTSSMTSSIVCAGTRFYMSPERLLPPFTPSFASDVWSLALLFLEVASGHPAPFFFNPNGKISVSIIHQHCPREFRDILTPCFEEDIKMRCCDLKQLEKAMVSKMFDVFISYRVATENDFALALYNKLVKQTNLRVFLDQSATGIPLGVEWGPYFFRALSCSTLVVPLVSVAGVLQPWTKDSNGQYPILKKVDNVLIEHQAALGFYQLHRSGQGNSEMSRVKCILPLFLGSPSNYDEIQFTLCGDIPDSISLGTQASGKSLCQTTGMTFAEGFFDKTVKR